MRILIITQWYDPEPTFKGQLFARELVKRGHEVEVITGFPNYPGGKIYQGYRLSLLKKEIVDGVNISRVWLFPSHDTSATKRSLNYISFFISSFLYGLIKANKADVIYAYHPPLTTSLAAGFIGKLRGVPVVLDIQDLWPDTLAATGMLNNEKILRVISKFCDYSYKLAKEIVVLSDGFKRKLLERGVSKDKVTVIYNWCNEAELSVNSDKDIQLPQNGFNVVFAGNIGKAQGVGAIVEAAKKIHDAGVEANLVLIGDGISLNEAKEKTSDLALQNVYFYPRVPMKEVGSIMGKADALLVHLNEDKLFEITIPSKTQAYMYLGKPIVMGVSGDAANLVVESKSGVVCKPNDPNSIADSIIKLTNSSGEELASMGHRAKKYYDEKMSLKSGVEEFLRIFSKVQKTPDAD